MLPGPRLWLWARQGTLAEGERAPDFTLPTVDRTASVTLSSHRGQRPVVLIKPAEVEAVLKRLLPG